MKWVPDETARSVLQKMGIKHSIKPVSIDSIDLVRSGQNCARSKAINGELVDNYAAAMGRGDAFPMIVLVPLGDKYVVAGGNHRLAAAVKHDEKEIDAIVCEKRDAHDFDILCKALNSRHGASTSLRERVLQAVDLITERNVPLRVACEFLNVSTEPVRNELAAQQVTQIGINCGVKTTWNNTCLNELSRVKLESVIEYVMEKTGTLKINQEQIRALRADLAKCKNEEEMLVSVDGWHEQVANAPRAIRRANRPNKARFLRAATELKGLAEECKNLKQLQVEPEECLAIIISIKESVSKICKLSEGG